jgi:3-deoxy-manno-octulosonate cytidylyltransferase (CMP-KDO synthetase)
MVTGVALIPSRLGSSRFPRKPLIELHGLSLIHRVWRQVSQAEGCSQVYVATDSEEIARHAESFGASVLFLEQEAATGTDRIAASVIPLALDEDTIILNVQGDQPLIDPSDLSRLIALMNEQPSVRFATLIRPIHDREVMENPNDVKVVMNQEGDALYFSRSPLPYPRQEGVPLGWKHLGVYAFRLESLRWFARQPQGVLEQRESLEQLRILEAGGKIHCLPALKDSPSVDVLEDALRLDRWLRANPDNPASSAD